MATLLLLVIYAAFISLGLPDALLGAAWPVMVEDLGVATSAAGAVSMTISGGTILSALVSGRVLARFGTANVTAVSTLMTAASLMGFALAPGLGWLVLLAVPLGLGAGSIDAGLNSYVAKHYAAHHMNWLHSFWAVGVTTGPLILSHFLRVGTWRDGYSTVSIIQFGLAVVLFLSLPLWRRVAAQHEAPAEAPADGGPADGGAQPEACPRRSIFHALTLEGVTPVLLVFLFYCGVEWTMGVWGGTFLVRVKGLEPATAAQWVSVYYGSIMVGRVTSGFVSMRLRSRSIIRIGQVAIVAGVVLLMLPLPGIASLPGFVLIGLGCAPIFPTMLHETPNYFGRKNAVYAMGLQMAVAYTGSTVVPPLVGLLADGLGFVLFPVVLLGFGLLMMLYSRRVNENIDTQRAPGTVR